MRVLSVVLSVFTVVFVASALAISPGAQAAPQTLVVAQDDSGERSGEKSSDPSDSSDSSEATQEGTEDGAELDPQTEADQAKNKNKIVVGIIAAVLLGAVIWGRYVRAKRAKGG